MLIFPVLVVALNGFFTAMLGQRFAQRHRSYQLVWTVALGLGLLAALFYLLFLADPGDVLYFRLYYLCGGLLVAAYLGLGSTYLHAGRRVGDVVALALVLASVAAAVFLFGARIDSTKLHAVTQGLGPGTSALGPGPWKAFAAVLNSFGALAVISGAVYSAFRVIRRGAPARYAWANLLIAGGTLIAGLAGAAADAGAFDGSFWLILCLGFVTLFGGIWLTLSPTSTRTAVEPSSGAREAGDAAAGVRQS